MVSIVVQFGEVISAFLILSTSFAWRVEVRNINSSHLSGLSTTNLGTSTHRPSSSRLVRSMHVHRARAVSHILGGTHAREFLTASISIVCSVLSRHSIVETSRGVALMLNVSVRALHHAQNFREALSVLYNKSVIIGVLTYFSNTLVRLSEGKFLPCEIVSLLSD